MSSDQNKTKVFYSERWGLRQEKYDWLESHDIASTDWQELHPGDPYYFFVPKDERGWSIYQKFWKVTDIFPVNSVGVVTGRDDFVIDDNRQALEARIRNFIESKEDIEYIKAQTGLKDKPPSRWFVKTALEKLRRDPDWSKRFTRILYRPFDEKWIFYHPVLVERTRENVMNHMVQNNLGLMSIRQIFKRDEFAHAFVTIHITDINSLHSPGVQVLFPLYLYNQERKTVFPGQEKLNLDGVQHTLRSNDEKKANLSEELVKKLEVSYKTRITPEAIFNYIYAVLYSNLYRQKYQEFLKVDFPRVPFTSDYKLFQKIAGIGEKLVNLHLLKSPELDNPLTKFHGENGGAVAKKYPLWRENRAHISESQYFSSISEELWQYYIGGYQVLEKWLKDRRGRQLSFDDIKRYCKIATAIGKTIELQKQVDEFYSLIERTLYRKVDLE